MFDYERHLVVAAVVAVIILVTAIVFIVAHVEEQPAKVMPRTAAVERHAYAPPSLEGFMLVSEQDADGDADGVKETHIRRYRSGSGDGIFNMITGGRLWAWSYDTHADDDSDITRNYVIRDSDCDGVFEQRYPLMAELHVPDCAKGPSTGSVP